MADGIPAIFLIPTGNTLPPSFIPGTPRPEFNSDLIFPFFQPNVDKFVPRSHSSNPGLFVEHLRPVGERMRLKVGARADWVSTNVEDAGRFPRYGFNGIFVTPDEVFFPAPVPQPIIPITVSDPVDVREELGGNDYGLGSFYLTGDYSLNDNWLATFGGGYAMRPPTLTELYSFNGPFLAILQRGGNYVFGNPDLDVPRIWQMDLGLQSDYGRFRGGANAYYSWTEDYITLRPLLPLGVISIEPQAFAIQPVQFFNTPLATNFGGELFAEYDLNDYFTAFAVSNYIQGTDQDRKQSGQLPELFFPATFRVPVDLPSVGETPDTEPLPGIPPWDNRIGLRLHDPSPLPTWGTEVSARIVDQQDRVATTLRELPTPGFTTYDFRSFWQVNENMLLLAGIENFTNKQYREHLDLRTGVFQPGINFYFGTQLVY